MPKHKFRKFERSQTPKSFRIGEIDLAILNDLAENRFLDSKHIIALHPEFKDRSVRSRLQLLYHGGYVERPASQFGSFHPAVHLIYSLAKKGAALVAEGKNQPAPAKQPKDAGVSFMSHSLMISDFKTIIELALKNNSQSKLYAWQEPGVIDGVYFEGERLPIAPDAFFTIEDKGDLLHFFLEADRSTMTLERMLNKLRAYWNWRAEGGQKKKLDISNFRVLTVALTEERKENLRQIARKADGSQTGSDIFWFACAKSYGLENPENILTPIWRSAKSESLRYLLE